MQAQLDALPYAHTAFFTTEPPEELADAPDRRRARRASTTSTWSRAASEADRGGAQARAPVFRRARRAAARALHRAPAELSRQHARRARRRRQRWRRAPFEPLLIEVQRMSRPAIPTATGAADETADAYGERLAAELERDDRRARAGTVIAFVAETVVGATLGAVPPVPGYFRRVREICDRHGILLILDEVMCGMGRTGTLYACEQEGRGAGPRRHRQGPRRAATSRSARCCVASAIYEAIAGGSGFFQHGHTYHRPRRGLRRRARRAARDRARGPAGPRARARRPLRSRGCASASAATRMSATSAAAASSGRSSWSPTARPRRRSTPRCACTRASRPPRMQRGPALLSDGRDDRRRRGDHVLLAPPFIVGEAQLDELVDKLGRALGRALADVGAG